MELVGIKNYKLIGLKEREFFRSATIWEADKTCLSFCYSSKERNLIEIINKSKASVVITEKNIDISKIDIKNKTIVLVHNPRLVFIKILNYCFPVQKNFSNFYKSIINDNVTIGKNVVIKPGCVIGLDGFGYEKDDNRELIKFPHYGGVIIEDNVEIGSNTVIDCGIFNDTIIGNGSKIDNLVHIAHNVIIGKNVMIIAGATICGGVVIKDDVYIAPHSTIIDNVIVGKEAFVGLGSVVLKDVPDNAVVVGNPAEILRYNMEKRK